MTSNQKPPTLDPLAVARWQRRAPAVTPWLHEEVARRMLDRLQWIKLEPALWAHWCAVRGGLAAHGELRRRYPRSFGFVMETEPQQEVPKWANWYISLGLFLLGLILFFIVFSYLYQ